MSDATQNASSLDFLVIVPPREQMPRIRVRESLQFQGLYFVNPNSKTGGDVVWGAYVPGGGDPGTIDQNGLFTAPASPKAVVVTLEIDPPRPGTSHQCAYFLEVVA